MNKDNLLIIFAKRPQLGKVKTRLAKSIGDGQALAVYRKLLKNILQTFKQTPYSVKVYWTPGLQRGKDLGERMANAFKAGLKKYQRVVIIGVDCPFVTKSLVRQAFSRLKTNKVVLGPAQDGGYYLIGLRKPQRSVAGFHQLFSGVNWGTSQVLRQTLARCRLLGIKPVLLKKLHDIDRIEDLRKWKEK